MENTEGLKKPQNPSVNVLWCGKETSSINPPACNNFKPPRVLQPTAEFLSEALSGYKVTRAHLWRKQSQKS